MLNFSDMSLINYHMSMNNRGSISISNIFIRFIHINLFSKETYFQRKNFTIVKNKCNNNTGTVIS